MIPGRRQCRSCGQLVVDALITGTAVLQDDGPRVTTEYDEPIGVVVNATPGPFGRYWRTDVAVPTVIDLAPADHPAAHKQHPCNETTAA